MDSLTDSDWSGIKRLITLCIIAFAWSYGSYMDSYPHETFRVSGLAFITSAFGLFFYGFGKNPCILWRYEFGDSLGLMFFEKVVISFVPIWFVAFPPFFANNFVKTFGFSDAVFALLLFLVMADFGGYLRALLCKLIEGRVEMSFRDVGLGYPPNSKLVTFIVFSTIYIIFMLILLKI